MIDKTGNPIDLIRKLSFARERQNFYRHFVTPSDPVAHTRRARFTTRVVGLDDNMGRRAGAYFQVEAPDCAET